MKISIGLDMRTDLQWFREDVDRIMQECSHFIQDSENTKVNLISKDLKLDTGEAVGSILLNNTND